MLGIGNAPSFLGDRRYRSSRCLEDRRPERRGAANYEQLYRVDDKQRVVVVPTAETNAGWINTALSELLQKVFSDTALAQFLKTGA
jgi:hypothetical protein